MKHLQKRKNQLDWEIKKIWYNPFRRKEKEQKERTVKSIEKVLEKKNLEETRFLKEKNIHLEDDPLYKKAKEENNLELLEKLKNRSLTPREYYENLYDEVKDFWKNLLLVRQDWKQWIIDFNTGDIKLQIKYDEINRFLWNYLRVKQDWKYWLIDSSVAGRRDAFVALPTEYEEIGDVQEVKTDSYSTKEWYYTYKTWWKYWLIDVKNKHILNPMYENIKWAGDNLFEVSKDWKRWLIPDIFFGSAVTYYMPCIYDEISDFGHAGAKWFYKFSRWNSVWIFSLNEEREILTLSGYHDIRYHRDPHGWEFRVRNNEHGYWEVYDKKWGYRTKVKWL